MDFFKEKGFYGVLLILSAFLGGCHAGIEADHRDRSPHFRDGVFHNTHETPKKAFGSFLWMRIRTDYAKWPRWVNTPPVNVDRYEAPDHAGALRVTYINHASFLIQTQAYTILTDPVYSERVSPVSFAGPKRVHAPGIPFDKLPKIDFILISHDHYDHLDLDTIERLMQRDNPKIYTGLGVGAHIQAREAVREMDWWDQVALTEDLRLTFVEVQHFSGRWLHDRNRTLWGGFVLEMSAKKIYFGGDSGYSDHYERVYEAFGPMDLAILPIGAYAPRSFMGPMHLDPKQAVQAHLDLHSKQSIGMHFGTFQLTAEPRDEPQDLLQKEVANAGLDPRSFITLTWGEPFDID